MAIIDRDHHWKQVLYDANAWRLDDFQHGKMKGLQSALRSEDWDYFLCGGLITSYNYCKQAMKTVKEYDKDIKIITGGGWFSAIPYDIMKLVPEIDYGVVGEAYKTLPELIRALQLREDIREVKGIAYRAKAEGGGFSKDFIDFTPPRDIIPDLDWLPFPAYDYCPLDIYFKNSSILMSEESMTAKRRIDIIGSLGCGFLCKFCWDLGITTTPIYMTHEGRTDVKQGRPLPTVMRYHSPSYLANLIEHCVKKYGCDFFAWVDENLQTSITKTKGQWFFDLYEELQKRDLIPLCVKENKRHNPKTCKGPHHGGTGHAGLCNRVYLDLMRKMGFTYLDYGLETWDRRIMQWLGKGSTVERNAMAIQETLDAAIRPIPNQIIGFPMEDWFSIKAMVDAWERNGIVTIPFIMTPYPGSEIFEKHRKEILEQYNGNMSDFLSDLEDATKITGLVCQNFNAVEIAGIQTLMGNASKSGDFKNLKRLLALSEAEWRTKRNMSVFDGAFHEYLPNTTETSHYA